MLLWLLVGSEARTLGRRGPTSNPPPSTFRGEAKSASAESRKVTYRQANEHWNIPNDCPNFLDDLMAAQPKWPQKPNRVQNGPKGKAFFVTERLVNTYLKNSHISSTYQLPRLFRLFHPRAPTVLSATLSMLRWRPEGTQPTTNLLWPQARTSFSGHPCCLSDFVSQQRVTSVTSVTRLDSSFQSLRDFDLTFHA